MDFLSEESKNGIRCSWNILPSNMIDVQRYSLPFGIHYTPLKHIENMQILEYDPQKCKICKSILSPSFQVDFRSKVWICPFCGNKNLFPKIYAENISEQNLPAELMPESSTIEYKLNKKESKWPVFVFIIDTSVDESELNELKETIQSTLSNIPQDCEIGLIVSGRMSGLVELGCSEYPKLYVFKGEKNYDSKDILIQLGLVNKNDPRVQTNSAKRFLVPLKECEFSVNAFLDDLFPDEFPQGNEERKASCLGLALNIAVSMLESVHCGDNCPSRIFLFAGGPPNVGKGKIVGLPLKETIRGYLDFEKGNENTKYFKDACNYYELLADRAFKAGQIIDIFASSLNQTGLLEMRYLIEKTGGMMVLTDSFSTSVFKDSFKRLFELDADGNLNMSFKGTSELFVSKPIKIKGALGHLVSMKSAGFEMVFREEIGEGKTRVWNLGGIDKTSTYTYIFDVDNSDNKITNSVRYCTVQFLTTYIAGDRSTRLRVTTFKRKLCPDLLSNKYEVAQSFDQEAAVVLLAKIAICKNFKEDKIDVLRWVDKSLIGIIKVFGEYTKDSPSSFKLTKEFSYFPQFVFYLRRSFVLSYFNASPDEVIQFKTILLKENVTNGTIMIQPSLFSYDAENSESTPVILEVENMKNDHVLLLDAYFFICIWYGEDVVKWREAGYQFNPEYENIKNMLESPVEYAQSLIDERNPVPRFVSADYGTGQERLIKSVLDPSTGETKDLKEGYFVSDDVSLKVFMEFLIKRVVSE